MEPRAIDYTPAMLARLLHAHTAYEMSERLVSEVSTYADSFGRGAFLTDQSASVLTGAPLLLEEAVIADRLRGASWSDVAEALGTSEDKARDEFSVWSGSSAMRCCFPVATARTAARSTPSLPTLSRSLTACGCSSTPGS